MDEKKFDPKKLAKLNNPKRLEDIPPEYIWQKLHVKNPNILVDIGAGTGFFALPFLKYVKSGKIFACDISDIMLGWMKDNICQEHPNIIPLKMEENVLSLDDNIADVVYMINLHHELEEPEKMLNEAFRILKRKGVIFIVDWKKEDMAEGPPVDLRYLPEKVKEQLTGAGFEDVTGFNEMPKHFFIVAEKKF